MNNSADGPPTYQSAISHDAMVQHEGEAYKADVKADAKADTNGAQGKADVVGSATGAASSSQLLAPPGARKINARYDADDGDYRRRDDETWPRDDSVQPICAVYGLYIESDDLFKEPHTFKLTDYNGGVLWHFLFPLSPWGRHLVLGVHVTNKATTWMVPGDQEVDNPRKGTKGRGLPWNRGSEPPTPAEYTWRLLRGGAKAPLQCADGRSSHYFVKIHDEEHQVFAGQQELTRRDYFEFSVPGSDRVFVWLCGGIMRNNRYTRWDRIDYVLHEKDNFSTQYGHTKWEPAFGLYLRQGLPKELDHALIVFALVNLMLMQHSMCQKFWQQPYIFTGGTNANQYLFNIPMLQKQAAEYGLRRQE